MRFEIAGCEYKINSSIGFGSGFERFCEASFFILSINAFGLFVFSKANASASLSSLREYVFDIGMRAKPKIDNTNAKSGRAATSVIALYPARLHNEYRAMFVIYKPTKVDTVDIAMSLIICL